MLPSHSGTCDCRCDSKSAYRVTLPSGGQLEFCTPHIMRLKESLIRAQVQKVERV